MRNHLCILSIFLCISSFTPILSTQNKSSGRLQYQMSIDNKTPYSCIIKEFDANENIITTHAIKPNTTIQEYFFKKCKRIELCLSENKYFTSLPLDMHQHSLTIIQDPHIKMVTH
jgi:hypothetical protein